MTEQLQKLPASLPVSHGRDIFMSQSHFSPTGKNNKIHGLLWRPSVWSGEGTHRRRKTGDFLRDGAAAAARKSCVLDGPPKKKKNRAGNTKPPSPGVGGGGGGCLHELCVLELPCEGALLDLDNCLQRSLDTSRQMPLPIKHSVVCSFTPQQLLSNSEKRGK